MRVEGKKDLIGGMKEGKEGWKDEKRGIIKVLKGWIPNKMIQW